MKIKNAAHLSTWFSYPDARIDVLSAADVPAVVDLINEAYQYQDEAKGEPRTSAKRLLDRAGRSDFYVAHVAQVPAGCVYVEPKGQILHFGLLTVAPAWRGKQLAPALMRAAEDYARHHRYARLELDYMSLAPWLRRYYERYGFAATGELTPWGDIDLIRMSKHLV